MFKFEKSYHTSGAMGSRALEFAAVLDFAAASHAMDYSPVEKMSGWRVLEVIHDYMVCSYADNNGSMSLDLPHNSRQR